MPDSSILLLQTLNTLRELSERMLSHAEQLDWSAAELCQEERAALIAGLPMPWPGLSTRENERVRILLGQIQSLDEAILELATPSRDQLSVLLAGLPAAPLAKA